MSLVLRQKPRKRSTHECRSAAPRGSTDVRCGPMRDPLWPPQSRTYQEAVFRYDEDCRALLESPQPTPFKSSLSSSFRIDLLKPHMLAAAKYATEVRRSTSLTEVCSANGIKTRTPNGIAACAIELCRLMTLASASPGLPVWMSAVLQPVTNGIPTPTSAAPATAIHTASCHATPTSAKPIPLVVMPTAATVLDLNRRSRDSSRPPANIPIPWLVAIAAYNAALPPRSALTKSGRILKPGTAKNLTPVATRMIKTRPCRLLIALTPSENDSQNPTRVDLPDVSVFAVDTCPPLTTSSTMLRQLAAASVASPPAKPSDPTSAAPRRGPPILTAPLSV